MSTSSTCWAVKVELLSGGQVTLCVSHDGADVGHVPRHCSIHDALRRLEVLFACSCEADFFLAVRAPDGPWCQLATRRWRLALYFITAQYERAFVGKPHPRSEPAPGDGATPLQALARPAEPGEPAHAAGLSSFVEQSGLVSVLGQPLLCVSACGELEDER